MSRLSKLIEHTEINSMHSFFICKLKGNAKGTIHDGVMCNGSGFMSLYPTIEFPNGLKFIAKPMPKISCQSCSLDYKPLFEDLLADLEEYSHE